MNATHHTTNPSPTRVERDLRVPWRPCTQMKDHETLPPIAIERGQGAWLEDFDGKRYLDTAEGIDRATCD